MDTSLKIGDDRLDFSQFVTEICGPSTRDHESRVEDIAECPLRQVSGVFRCTPYRSSGWPSPGLRTQFVRAPAGRSQMANDGECIRCQGGQGDRASEDLTDTKTANEAAQSPP